MGIFLGIIIFVLGLCVGSFVNMAVYRCAINYKLESRKFKVKSKNRSYCDFCGRQLKWYENIPVISWILQKGKSRCCNKKLSVSYPLLELGMGVLFLVNFQFFPPSGISLCSTIFNFQTLINFVIVTFLVFSAVFDVRYMILPDFSTRILIICAVALLFLNKNDFFSCLLAGLEGGGFLLLLHVVTKGKGMGMGDVKLAIFMGLFLGYPNTVIAFYVAFISGALIGVILMLIKKLKRKSEIAFGPFLILGTFIAWYFGSEIMYYVGDWL